MRYALVALLGVSSGAGADVVVQYEGKVDSLSESCWCHPLPLKAGDPIAGRFTIDTDHAPSDIAPGAGVGSYVGGKGLDFITGDHFLIGNLDLRGNELMLVRDRVNDALPPGEEYRIVDSNDVAPVAASRATIQLVMNHTNPALDFIHGDGIDQSFTAGNDPAKGVQIVGLLQRWVGAFNYSVRFVVDRMSVKLVCRS